MMEHQDETVMENMNATSGLRKRICLVASVATNEDVCSASKLFNVPVEVSETGQEFLNDESWTTYFILSEFEGAIFDNLNTSETNHKILGPPAFLSCANSAEELPSHSRPIYNYSMKGVVTAFSGIRKRDELTKLVHLIHFMGGSIRKEMNHRATHLICSNAFGDKYRYALTFRLNVVRSSWVLDAWHNRDSLDFTAKKESFTGDHRLKIFEGCKVAFIGFPDNERANMVELLRSYNGIDAASDDDTCTHKIIADCPLLANEHNNVTDMSFAQIEDDGGEYDEMVDDEKNEYACQVVQRKHDLFLRHFEENQNENKDLPIVMEEDETVKSNHSETTHQPSFRLDDNLTDSKSDGAVLRNEEKAFTNISPILKTVLPEGQAMRNEEYDGFPDDSIIEGGFRENFKRKRFDDDSMDNISFMSVESSKKPKLFRAGSLTKNIRRRMSFGIVTPINNLFRQRRSSTDNNTSNCSTITNMENTFNESIKEPIKEKFRQIKDKVCKLSKKDSSTPKSTKAKMRMASANLTSLKDVCHIKTSLGEPSKTPEKNNQDLVEFKTPKPVTLSSNTPSTVPRSFKPRSKAEESARKEALVEEQFANSATTDKKLVIDENSIRYDHGTDEPKYFVVKAEWFWTRIAEGYAPEDDFLYKDYMQSVKDGQAEHCERRDSLINYSAKGQRKRKRLSRLVLDGTPVSAGKRRSSISDAGILSESLIDYTASPDKNDSAKFNETKEIDYAAKKFSMRHNHFLDFYHTESNYVGILETIVKLFKHPLEKLAEENGDQADLLNKSEVKAIFSNFLPIYETHKKMLNALQEINNNWKEESAIGQIILNNRDMLLKAYPPYVNFFEQMKAALIQCMKSKPRFQAFLKINQAKAECGRQSLSDLMIRPVQRLPSISLLLNDILKHTPKPNPDHNLLTEALRAIKEVMTYINEDKRKTEGQKQMFDIFNDIENCPPHLVSSHRSFISRCEVTELSEILSGRGDTLMLFLFSDTLEVCKKRSRYNYSKSPNALHQSRHASNSKPYKHIKLIPLSTIRTLADISDSPRAFAISLRSSSNIQDLSKDKLYSFSISDEEIDKTIYIKNVCKQLAENACRADAEKFLVSIQSQEIGIDTLVDVNLGTLSKAFRLATRTRLKVGRAFSFSKTPSRKRMPSPFGSNISLTPSTISSMSHLKLQASSSLTLNDMDMDRREAMEHHPPPLTDQMSRRNKNTGIGDV